MTDMHKKYNSEADLLVMLALLGCIIIVLFALSVR
jgi:hypothetical protein